MYKVCFFLLLVIACCVSISISAKPYEESLQSLRIDEATKTIIIQMDDDFANQVFTEKKIKKIYKKVTKDVHKALPKQYKDYNVRIYTRGYPIEGIYEKETPVESKKHKKHHGGWWGDIYYEGEPWVKNVSKPHALSSALNGKHISLWASHGKYYDKAQNTWKWQRPRLFCTSEDLFTQTIVVPYLIPMLENAGAVVFTPRERDWQPEEIIVDNDNPGSGYSEMNTRNHWKTVPSITGFSIPEGQIYDGYNPFEYGTIRQINTTNEAQCEKAVYTPMIRKSGKYAVYVSYATVEGSTDCARYVVWHKGIRTEVNVNQRMGGGTWVYIGTFEFDSGASANNCVEVLSYSKAKGIVTTDAVRFGGGMGNIVRGEGSSSVPRCLEGARYYAQWAGVPYSVYSLYKGDDDYKDDINVRSFMTNWLAGGSPFAPNKEGKNVPIELCLAVHSDAGYNKDFKSIFGSLAVCTTDFNEGKLDAGVTREHSKDFATMLLERSKKDLISHYGQWRWRELYDKNYSETRLPAMPSAIFETLSHQSFPDMLLAHDPDFKFTLARSIYKTILNFEADAHNEKYVVSPLAPRNFRVMTDTLGNAHLVWTPQMDADEPSAKADSYNIYTSIGVKGYDNGVNVKNNSYSMRLIPDIIYRFKVTAVNEGGESFPTEELAVVWHGSQAKNILVVNGFQRLAAPQVVNEDSIKGFNMSTDQGLSYGVTAGWCGNQIEYNIASSSFGNSYGNLEGQFIAGNTFNYVGEHVEAIASAYSYNVSSCSRDVVESGNVNMSPFVLVDLILGNERNDGYSLQPYKTFTPQMRQRLISYCSERGNNGHALLVSGSYVASDMTGTDERSFLEDILHISSSGRVSTMNNYVNNLNQPLILTNSLNPDHYAVLSSDVLMPQKGGFVSMQYNDGQAAAVAYKGFVSTFVMGFPFECITNSAQRSYTMRGIINFLLSK